MRIYPRRLALIALLATLGTTGCEKKDKQDEPAADTISGELTGKWTLVKMAYDDNFNLVMDGDEVEIPSSQFEAVVTLNADGTGATFKSFTGQPRDTAFFKWSRLSTAELTSEVTKGSDHYLAKYTHIKRLNDSELVIVDTARGHGNWELNWTFFRR